jgi:2'-5' RNA ligase
MKLAIVLFPPKEVQDYANTLRKRYDPKYALISPHMTLLEPFDAEENQLTDIVQQLRQVAALHKPFEVKLNKFSNFYPTSHVIYMAVQSPDPIKSLHEGLNQPPYLHQEQHHIFVPHITIAQGLPTDELHDIYSRIKMVTFLYSFTVERCHLIYQLENMSWSIHQSFNLGEDC